MKARLIVLVAFLLACAGCRALFAPTALPDQSRLELGQLVVHTDFPLPRQHRLLSELTALRDDVSRTLDVAPSDEPVHVYLFENGDQFRRFMERRYPTLPSRRAFFMETDTQLAVFAHWGDRVAEDLRHETVHGYLHSVVPHLPLWLDEGLAEFFEVARGDDGLNEPHLVQLHDLYQRGQWRPDLARLERLASIGEMKQIDYAESWAWVHFLLRTTDARRRFLHQALAKLRRDGRVESFDEALRTVEPGFERRLIEHLTTLSAERASRQEN